MKRREKGMPDLVLQDATGGFKTSLEGYEFEGENLDGVGVVVAVGVGVQVVVGVVFGRGGLVVTENPSLELVDEGGDGGIT